MGLPSDVGYVFVVTVAIVSLPENRRRLSVGSGIEHDRILFADVHQARFGLWGGAYSG
jgi:hypothetical protein